MDHILIEGFIGSGKKSVGKSVAKKAKLSFVDIDKQVTKRMNMTVGEIYDRFGEPYFRAMETLMLEELASDENAKRSVVVLSSAMPSLPQNVKYMKQLGRIYYLKMKKASLIDALSKSDQQKWLKGDGEGESLSDRVTKLLKEREPVYKKTADAVVSADGKTPDEIAEEILAAPAAEETPDAPVKKKATRAKKTSASRAKKTTAEEA